MPICVGVAFKRVARSYWFDPNGISLKEGDRVVVETSHGEELGSVKIGPREAPIEDMQSVLNFVLRHAGAEDAAREKENLGKAREALVLCKERIGFYGLSMKLLQAEYSFDASQVTIYFASESRVDFRNLVRDLAAELHVRVQMHQVGARDEAKILGGVGPCGLTLCCATFLTEFAPVSMKMAKDQSLFLNPVKFSGICGKLMCCLRYEHETYVEARSRMPQIGAIVMSPRGQGKVAELNLLKETVIVHLFESGAELEFIASELKIEKTTRCTDCRGCQVDQLQDDAAESTLL